MKKIVCYAVIALGLMGCKSENESNKEAFRQAKDKQAEATVDYEHSQAADTSEYALLKAGTKKIIADNERRIAEFRLSLNDKTAQERARLNQRIEALEARNQKLGRDLDRFGEQADEHWDTFKTRVSKNVEDIRRDIKDLRNDEK